jgi:hypothetical protein
MDKTKDKFPAPPSRILLSETASENVVIGSREHVDMTPAQRERTTYFNSVKNLSSQVEKDNLEI